MNPFAAVRAIKHLYDLRKAMKLGDHDSIMRACACYGEWSIRRGESKTSEESKIAVAGFLESLRGNSPQGLKWESS